jgi:hypothetical protein
MKCVKKGNEIQRVSDEKANTMINSGWAFCPKSEWKVIRDAKKAPTNVKTNVSRPAAGDSEDPEPKESKESKSQKQGNQGKKGKESKYSRKSRS